MMIKTSNAPARESRKKAYVDKNGTANTITRYFLRIFMPITLMPQVRQDPHNPEKGFLTGFQPTFVNEKIIENKVRKAARALVENKFQGGHLCAKTTDGTRLWVLAKPDPETAVHIIVSDKRPLPNAHNDFGDRDLSHVTEERVTKAIQKVLIGLGLAVQ